MKRKRRGPYKGYNSASLANLKRGENPAPVENRYGETHGFRGRALVKDVEKEVAELAALLAESAPLRDPDGSLPAADRSPSRRRHAP